MEAVGELGKLIRELRTIRGMTQAELGDAAGLSGATVSRIETGDSTTAPTLLALAHALHVDVERLRSAHAVELGLGSFGLPADDPRLLAIAGDWPYLSDETKESMQVVIRQLATQARRLELETEMQQGGTAGAVTPER